MATKIQVKTPPALTITGELPVEHTMSERFSNGWFGMGIETVTMNNSETKETVGEVVLNIGGNITVTIGKESYGIKAVELFKFVMQGVENLEPAVVEAAIEAVKQ